MVRPSGRLTEAPSGSTSRLLTMTAKPTASDAGASAAPTVSPSVAFGGVEPFAGDDPADFGPLQAVTARSSAAARYVSLIRLAMPARRPSAPEWFATDRQSTPVDRSMSVR